MSIREYIGHKVQAYDERTKVDAQPHRSLIACVIDYKLDRLQAVDAGP